MLAVNGKVLVMTDNSDPYVQRVQEGYTKLRKMKFPISIKYPERFKIINPHQPNEKPRWPGGKHIHFETNVDTPNGGELWAYFESNPTVNGEKIFLPKGFTFTGRMNIPQTKMDLAYYMLFICPRCENSLNANVVMNDSDKYYVIEDKHDEALNKISKEYDETKCKSLVLIDSESEKVREVAYEMNIYDARRIDTTSSKSANFDFNGEGIVSNVHAGEEPPYILSIEEVKSNLWDLIDRLSAHDKGIYSKVIDKFTKGKTQGKQADLLQKAIDLKVVALKQIKVAFKYIYTETEKDFCRCGTLDRTEKDCFNTVVDKMKNNENLYNDLLEAVKKVEAA